MEARRASTHGLSIHGALRLLIAAIVALALVVTVPGMLLILTLY
jgi:hypothetical protein